jgi:transposase
VPDGRPSIAPERLLRALLLQALFTVRSERQLMQQIIYNMLFRWFVGLAMDVPVWDVTVFTKNRDRLLEGDVACGFLAAILADPAVKPLLSTEHFSVDGTLIEAWASMKSFRPKSLPSGLTRGTAAVSHRCRVAMASASSMVRSALTWISHSSRRSGLLCNSANPISYLWRMRGNEPEGQEKQAVFFRSRTNFL